MMFNKKKMLMSAVLLSVASVGFVASASAAEETGVAPQAISAGSDVEIPTYHLAEVVVNGDRYIAGEYLRATNRLGILGEVDAMSSPISVNTISEKAVEDFMSSTEGLSKMLSLVPSVQKTADAAVDTINIRGFSDDGRGFSVNGIPGMQAMTRQSSIYIDSVDVIEGPSTGITSTGNRTNDGGTININSKKAYDTPTRNIGVKYHSTGSHEEYVDLGQRFGKDNEWGVRFNASNTAGERAIHHWNLTQRSFYANIDHKSDNSKTNFMIGHTYTDSKGRPYGFSLNSKYIGDALPDAPDGDINPNPLWRRDKNTNFVMTLNHEQKLGDHLSAFLNAGHFKQDWYYYTGFSKTLLNQAGDFTATSDNYSLIEKRDYAQIGLRGDFKTGDLTHKYTLGVDRQWQYYGGPANSVTERGWTGSIYQNANENWNRPTFGQSDAYYNQHYRNSGWSISDSITTSNEKLNILIGLNGKSIKRDRYNVKQQHTSNAGHFYDVSPFYGINYTFDPHIAIYANHTEDFVQGTVVGSSYNNAGEVLDPYKTKQTEFGVKLKTGDFLHKLSYFDIKKANTMTDDNNNLTNNGERRHKGIEYMGTGTLAEKWNLIGGFMYLDTEQKTASKASNGKRVNGVPEWTANLGVEYVASDDFSAITRLNYVGSSKVLDEKYGVPSYFTMDLGVKYKTEWGNTPVTLNAMCYNLFDKSYWQPSGNTLHTGGPRTFMLSADFQL